MTILDAVYPNGKAHRFRLLGVVGVVVGGSACGVIVGAALQLQRIAWL